MTHKESRERRQQIAKLAADGMTVDEICSKFSVSAGTVLMALREFGVQCQVNRKKYRHHQKGLVFIIIAQLQNTKLSFAEIGRRLELSKQRVHQIYCAAKEAGIHFHKREKEEN